MSRHRSAQAPCRREVQFWWLHLRPVNNVLISSASLRGAQRRGMQNAQGEVRDADRVQAHAALEKGDDRRGAAADLWQIAQCEETVLSAGHPSDAVALCHCGHQASLSSSSVRRFGKTGSAWTVSFHR